MWFCTVPVRRYPGIAKNRRPKVAGNVGEFPLSGGRFRGNPLEGMFRGNPPAV